jgi:hypothetical protein
MGGVTLQSCEMLERRRSCSCVCLKSQLLEHESFTELLRAILHLKEELLRRTIWIRSHTGC